MDNIAKLKKVYDVMEKRGWIVRDSSWGITGPIFSGAISDQAISDLRTGANDSRKAYRCGLEQNIAVPSNCAPAIEEDFEVLKAKSEEPNYNAQHWFDMAADMLVLRQAGILIPENYSESTELTWHKPSTRFLGLTGMSEDKYKAFAKRLAANPGNRDAITEQDLIDFDTKVLEAYAANV